MPKILERPSDATLRQLYQELRNCAKVGQQIGASENTAKRWLQEAGVQVGRGRPPGDDDASPYDSDPGPTAKRGAPPPKLGNKRPSGAHHHPSLATSGHPSARPNYWGQTFTRSKSTGACCHSTAQRKSCQSHSKKRSLGC